LKQVCERDPSLKFNLVERTKYWPILKGHPAIANVGNPPPGAEFIGTAYWEHEDYRAGKRAYQVLAGMFGLETPADERLFVAWEFEDDPVLIKALPHNATSVVVCQSSDSPRKQMSIRRWESLVAMLSRIEIGVVQVGRARDPYIRGTYNCLGLTSPRQLISLLRHFDAVITSDSFVMHAAKLCETPAVVLWGPTKHSIYGYSGHTHLQSAAKCDRPNGCIGPNCGEIYASTCPHGDAHCVDTIPVESIYDSVVRIINGK
jgi:ADP-heptose:LPS heptosyltransferase